MLFLGTSAKGETMSCGQCRGETKGSREVEEKINDER
jgi:hypothetical protein